MASVESATALLTAVSIGIATVAILTNNLNFDFENDSSLSAILSLFTLFGSVVGMVTAFGFSLYYLYRAEFGRGIFPLTTTPQRVFVLVGTAAILGISFGLVGIIILQSQEQNKY